MSITLKEETLWRNFNSSVEFVRDGAFPFKVGYELVARIEEGKVVIEKKT